MIDNNSQRLPGWSVLAFLVAAPLFGLVAFWILPERTNLSVLATFFAVGLLGIAVAVLPLGRNAPAALGLRPVGWRPVVLAVVGTTILSFVVSQLGPQPEGVRQVTEGIQGVRALQTLAVLGFLAPLAEELVFRGLLYGWLAGRWSNLVAFVVSSLAFAAAHTEPVHILLVLPLGFWFGWLRWRTGSLVPTIVAHMINNTIAVAAAAFLGGS
ncbi:type II CAAX endopeptidase family protein [uncultured Reyranella sp.]|uniref:CPBP family intramembrane glutamic endopeptidase n=1 Tax=uncultured Reyranella sp. TaxID=735512 RepID=UPI00259CB66E|nr:type II CAAX endopeptidase family protein [uncultured Reyranella sp.]